MTDFLNPELIESVLSTVFDLYKSKVVSTPNERAAFDFVLKGNDNKKVAIEIKGRNVSSGMITNLRNSLAHHSDIDEFILITPSEPNPFQRIYFKQAFDNLLIKASWTSIQDYLKKNFNLDIKSNEELNKLQIAAITSKIANYSNENIGSDLPKEKSKPRLKEIMANAQKGDFQVSNHLLSLRRQFPDKFLSSLGEADILNQLHIGNKYNDAIIVLTDIKNFSTIVTAADPDDLNETMSKYYNNARDLVFKYGGILDKFIGDAVLAIFNYPKKGKDSYLNTLKFCSELILLGNETFQNLLRKMDQSVETGTRIGVANGPIYTLNIGKGEIEVTFIGDKINFAARLEKNCDVNGILLSNRFCNKFSEEFFDLWQSIEIKERELSPDDAKGQQLPTKCWQIPFDEIKKVINYEPTKEVKS